MSFFFDAKEILFFTSRQLDEILRINYEKKEGNIRESRDYNRIINYLDDPVDDGIHVVIMANNEDRTIRKSLGCGLCVNNKNFMPFELDV